MDRFSYDRLILNGLRGALRYDTISRKMGKDFVNISRCMTTVFENIAFTQNFVTIYLVALEDSLRTLATALHFT